MSRRLSPAVAQDTRNEATSPASMFRQQSPLGTPPVTTSGECPDTLLVARSLIRLASEFSPSSLPTPESLEMAASAYQVAMKLHQPNPSTNNSVRIEKSAGQMDVIEDFHKELKAIRKETSQAFLRLDEKFEALRGDIASLKLQSFPIAESIEKTPKAATQASLQTPNAASQASLHTSDAASQPEDTNAGLAFLEGEPEVLEPSWDFDESPSASQTATSHTWEPKQLQTIEEEVGSHDDTTLRGRGPVGSPPGLRGKQAPTWPEANRQPVDEDRSESVKTYYKILVNTLTQDNYNTASNRMIREMNKSDRETNAVAVKLVADLVFETAINEVRPPDMCARLCRKIMENLSEDIRDDNMRDPAGELLVGGLLFRKYLLIKCQDYFERGWSTKPGPWGAQNFRTSESKRIEDASKTRRQGLGVVRFIGELFKLQMLNERIMHECIKKLLAKVDNPDEGELESACTLLTIVGRELDTSKAQDHFDIYFSTIRMLADDPKLSTALRRALTDVIELRQRDWRPRNGSAGPASFAQAREPDAPKIVPNTRWGSQRDGRGTAEQGPGGWNVTGQTPARAPARAGDLSNFGKFTTSSGPLKTMGPSSAFKMGDRGRDTPSPSTTGSLSRATSRSTTPSHLGDSGTDADVMSKSASSGRGTPPKPSIDPAPQPPQNAPLRKKLQLLPRSVSSTNTSEGGASEENKPGSEEDKPGREEDKPGREEDKPEREEDKAKSEEDIPKSEEEQTSPAKSYTEQEAEAKVDEDVKEFFNIRDVSEGEKSFAELPDEHKSKLVHRLACKVLDLKEADVKLVAELFERVASKACPPSAFEDGLAGIIEFLDDTETDVPQVYTFMARMLRGSKLRQETVESMADKIYVDGEPEVKPKDKLLKAYEALS
ncbi:hypothetical protein FS837_000262 [Tulasnella sp. UAMH 9824]|nr:hypothetical protein FS837_000262 [Tulasnella sp. UAMH 9824]